MRHIFTFILAVLLIIPSKAQLNFTNYGSQNSISALLEEGNFIWIGTSGGAFKRDRSTGQLVSSITMSDGLPCNAVVSIKIDNKGNKWFGTYGNGIGVFNASLNKWTYYNKTNGLESNLVTSMYIDQNDEVWVTTSLDYWDNDYHGGLYHFDGTSWEHITPPLGNEYRGTAVLVDDIGNLWYANESGGIQKRDFSGNWSSYYPSEAILCITKDLTGNIWFGSWSGVIKFDGNTTWTQYTKANTAGGLATNDIGSIMVDMNGNVWCGNIWNNGTNDWFGISKYDGVAWTQYTPHTAPIGLADQVVRTTLIDAQGNVWFGTPNGLSKLDGTTDNLYDPIRSLNNILSNTIYDLCIDGFDNKWYATANGLSKFNSSTNVWTSYTTSNGLPENEVRTVAVDLSNNIWIGTYSKGVAKLSTIGTWTYYTNANTGGLIPIDYIQDIEITKSGIVWVSTGSGIAKYNGAWTKYTTGDGLINNDIVSIKAESNSVIWFGSRSNGLSKFNGSTFTNYTTADGLAHNSVWDIEVDKAGNKWFANGYGLTKYDGTTFTKYWVTGMAVPYWTLAADSLGNLWTGGTQTPAFGLIKFDGSHKATFTIQDGLPNNEISCIEVDAQGNKWIGTYGGASKVSCEKPVVLFESDKACFGEPGSKTNFTNLTEAVDSTTKYSWDIGNNGSVEYTIKDAEHAYANYGIYQVELKAVNDQCADSILNTVIVNSMPALANSVKKISACAGSNVTLGSTISNYDAGLSYTFEWSSGQTEQYISTGTAGKYIVTAANENCVSKPDTFDVTVMNPYDASTICIATVGHETGKNVIVWERQSGKRSVSYNVYKMIGLGYILVGNVPYDSAGLYVDYSSMPDVISNRYAISVVDSCGNESKKSPYIQTINLGASLGVDTGTAVLNWTPYVDESKAFEPDFYYIYKGMNKTGIKLVDSVSGNFTLYNDKNRKGATYYQIGIKKPALCNEKVLKAESGPYAQSLSNIAEYKVEGASLAENELNVSIYPNPASNFVIVSALSYPATISITDISGHTIMQTNMTSSETKIDVSNLASGCYLISVQTENGRAINKMMKE